MEGQGLSGTGEMSTAIPSEGIRSFLFSGRKLLVSFAAEASIADYGGQAGWELDS